MWAPRFDGCRVDFGAPTSVEVPRPDWHPEHVSERRFPHLPSRPTRIVFYVVAIAVLLGINYWGAHRVTEVTRNRIPYSPVFLQEVRGYTPVPVAWSWAP